MTDLSGGNWSDSIGVLKTAGARPFRASNDRRRLQAKATAVSLARYFNRALGLDPLDLARYAV